MSIFKRRKKDEEKPLLLKGYVEKTQRVQKEPSSKLEERANLLYSDALEPKKKVKKLEPVSFEGGFGNPLAYERFQAIMQQREVSATQTEVNFASAPVTEMLPC